MKKILLDTNCYSALAKGDMAVLGVLSQAETVYLSAVMLGELFAGFKSGSKETENRTALNRFLEKPTVRTLAVTPDTAEIYAIVKHELRKAGTPIPVNDVWIAAHALEAGAVMVSYDRHFSGVPGLRIWDQNMFC